MAAIATVLALASSAHIVGQDLAWHVRAGVVGAPRGEAPLSIELLRWSTDAEREPLMMALSAPPPAPPAGRGAGRAGGGGRGGRSAAPPPSPAARLTSAVKGAPTVGFVWRDGPTGYSIKYAWRSKASDGKERVVLITDRRIVANSPSWPTAAETAEDADFTVIEMRVDGRGMGEGKASVAGVVLDSAAGTLTLEGYDHAPAVLKVMR